MQVFRLTTYHRYVWRASPLLVVYAGLVGWLLFKLGLAEFFLYQVVLASLWLMVVARDDSRRASLMLGRTARDAAAARSIAASISLTKRYYAYSSLAYVGVLCLAYLAAVGGIPAGVLDSSRDPIVSPLVRWISSLSAGSIIAIAAGIYLAIGFMAGGEQVFGRGVYGAKGPGYTVLAWTLLWPVAGLLLRTPRR